MMHLIPTSERYLRRYRYLRPISVIMKTLNWIALVLAVSLSYISQAAAQDIVGEWKTIDDRTNLPTSHIEIFEQGGSYFGRVVGMLRDDPSSLCTACQGDKKNEPIMKMTILRDMVKVDDTWTNGFILDPECGKEYKCNIHLESENKLILRGYIGVPLFGRSQDWLRVSK